MSFLFNAIHGFCRRQVQNFQFEDSEDAEEVEAHQPQVVKADAPNWLELPPEVAMRVFNYCSDHLVAMSYVCRNWQYITSAIFLKDSYLPLVIFDASVWRQYIGTDEARAKAELPLLGLDLTDHFVPLTKKKIADLRNLWLKVRGACGVTLLTIPRGLTLRKLVQIALTPLKGKPTHFYCSWQNKILEKIVDKVVGETVTVAIANSIIDGTSRASLLEQEEVVEYLSCELPGTLPTATLAILTFIINNKRLFDGLYVRCAENSDWLHIVHTPTVPEGIRGGRFPYVVKYSEEDGLDLNCLALQELDLDNSGAGAMYRLE